MLDSRFGPRKTKVGESRQQFSLGRLCQKLKDRVSLATMRELTANIDLLFNGVIEGVPALRDIKLFLYSAHS
jgi:hypothetical protein